MGRLYERLALDIYRANDKKFPPLGMLLAPLAGKFAGCVLTAVYQMIGANTSSRAQLKIVKSDGTSFDDMTSQFPVFNAIGAVYVNRSMVYVWGECEGDQSMMTWRAINLEERSVAVIEGPAHFEICEPRTLHMHNEASIFLSSEDRSKFYLNVPGMEDSSVYHPENIDAMGIGAEQFVCASPNYLAIYKRPEPNSDPNSSTTSSDRVTPATPERPRIYSVKGLGSARTVVICDELSIAVVSYSLGAIVILDLRERSPKVMHILRSQHKTRALYNGEHYVAVCPMEAELAVARHSTDHPVPWIELYDLTKLESKEILVSPQMPLRPGSTRYLDPQALWPREQRKFRLPDNPVDYSQDPQFINDERRALFEVDNLVCARDKFVIATESGLFFIEARSPWERKIEHYPERNKRIKQS